MKAINELFRKFSNKTSEIVGSSWAFLTAVAVVVVWFITGPIFKFSDTWQLVINTGTTIVTFLMVFLIQNTQNRDAKAIHLKLDELIRSLGDARNEIIDIENLSDDELKRLQEAFHRLKEREAKNDEECVQAVEEEERAVEEELGERGEAVASRDGRSGRSAGTKA